MSKKMFKPQFGIFIGSMALVSFWGCASGTKTSVSTAVSPVYELDETSATAIPKYSFDEFFKTSGLSSFVFRPDGKAVYFLKNDGKVLNIFEYNFRSKAISQVTHVTDQVADYYADPNGRFLYLIKDKGGNEAHELFQYDLKLKKLKNLIKSDGVEGTYPCDISNDGSKLFYAQTRGKRQFADIYYLDLTNLKPVLIMNGEKQRLVCSQLDSQNKTLGIGSFVNNDEYHVGLVNLASNESIFINSDSGVRNGDISFLKDGSAIFLSNKASDGNRLWKYEPATRKLSLLDLPTKGSVATVAVSPNSKFSYVNYRGPLFPETQCFEGVFAKPVHLQFQPKDIVGITLNRKDDQLAILEVQEKGTPTKYYLKDGDQINLIYDSNHSKIPSNHFAKAYSVLVPSFDGVGIPTHLYVPSGASSKNKKPILVFVHGGPDDHFDPTYSPIRQFVANQGFVVVIPNFRGSSGYGEKFQDMLNGDWGGAHIRDDLAALEYAKSLPFTDSKNVFLAGGSFGGFSVMSLVTQYPNAFKAASDLYGPIELATFVNSWPESIQSHWLRKIGTDPRKEKSFNQRVSPFYHLDKVSIPLQVQQGENDIRVPKAQSDQLVQSLKSQGKEVEYIVFPGEGHGFEKFENQRKSWGSMTEFFSSKVSP